MVIVVACGARTGDQEFLLDDGLGSGGSLGSGDGGVSGAGRGGTAAGRGGVSGSGVGGTLGFGGTGFGGSAGIGPGGAFGAAGSFGRGGSGFGGSFGSGFGGSFGSGVGGSAGSGVFCGDRFCPSMGVAGNVFTLPACCAGPFTCGVDATQMSPVLPIYGCVETNQPGFFHGGCPTLSTPIGNVLPGCCKPNGMCGNDFNSFFGMSLGCVDTTPYTGAFPVFCGGGVGGSVGFGGVGGIGGRGGAAGFGGVGGFGGAIGAGGFGGTLGAGGVSGVGGTGGTNSCCDFHPTPGCDSRVTADCVCSRDPFCCTNYWDSTCVNLAFRCGGCSIGSGGAAGVGGSFGGVGGSIGGVGGSIGGIGGSGGVGECIAQANTSCDVCLCASCFSQLGACIGDFGCPAIISCVAQTGCQGVDCYRPDTCQSMIDAFGGPGGTSVAITQRLFTCARNNGCPCGL